MNKFTANLKTKRGQAAAFRNAAKVLDRYGWRRGSMGTMTTGFCAMGALNHLLGTRFDGEYSELFHAKPTPGGAIDKAVGGAWVANSREDAIILFNDSLSGPDKLANKRAVQSFFRKIAANLEHGGVL